MARLGKNPLETVFDVERERQELGYSPVGNEEKKARGGRPRNENIVREGGASQGLEPDYMRATFIIKKESLQLIKDYAYTERMSIKDALQEMVDYFFDNAYDPNELLHKER